jgi:hypothetical protein
MKPFDATGYLRELARGKHGAHDLTRVQARALFTAISPGRSRTWRSGRSWWRCASRARASMN